jgi:hypothetical protein
MGVIVPVDRERGGIRADRTAEISRVQWAGGGSTVAA